jgi:uncharacterized membrane protein SirB2
MGALILFWILLDGSNFEKRKEKKRKERVVAFFQNIECLIHVILF